MSENVNKGIIVAGMHSSSGKTAVTSLVLAAMHIRGLSFQPFKIGPDYIDPGYHLHYSAKNSVNLDPWIMGQDHVVQAARQFTKNSLGVAEGVMGLFDGSDPETDVRQHDGNSTLAWMADIACCSLSKCRALNNSLQFRAL